MKHSLFHTIIIILITACGNQASFSTNDLDPSTSPYGGADGSSDQDSENDSGGSNGKNGDGDINGSSVDLTGAEVGDGDGDGDGDQDSDVDDGKMRKREQTFSLASTTSKIDMIWTIDNSGSMANGAQNVQDNFEEFIATLDDNFDLKLALISETTSNTSVGFLGQNGVGVDLPRTGPNFKQVDVTVGSWDPLGVALSASCSEGSSCARDIEIDDPLANIFNQGSDTKLADVRGTLDDFLRPDAQRIYVFVTDDDARTVTNSNFLEELDDPAKASSQNPFVFGFVGTGSSDCDFDREGRAYSSLARETGGSVYDICESDWSKYFDQLVESTEEISQKNFVLTEGRGTVEVVAVLLNGEELTEQDYTLEDRKITLADGVGEDGAELVVRYRAK